MKCLTGWTALVMCLAVALVGGAACRAQGDRSRQRRIIVNDGGGVKFGGPTSVGGDQYGETIEDLLAVRFSSLEGTQVDSYFFSTAATSLEPVVDGEVIPLDSTMAQFYYWGEPGEIHPATERATRAMIKLGHAAEMEIFASIRMNDIHDAWSEKLTYPLKTERPDLLIGEQYWPDGYPHLLEGEEAQALGGYPETSVLRAFWSGLDYAKQEVRDHFRDFILSYCQEYNYDGVELDYFRHPLFFKLGEEEENLENMTEFVRQVRQGLNEIGRERGRPYLLAIRVPDTPEQSRRTGLDVEQWLKEDLLDMLMIGGGYMPYAGRLKEFIDLAHRYGVPAYPSRNGLSDYIEGYNIDPIELRGVASNFWALGADGVYIFNYDPVYAGSERHECLKQIGDPDTLLGLDKQYLPDNGYSRFYFAYSNAAGQFPAPGFQGGEHHIHPVRLIDGTPIELVVGDDVQKATEQGILAEMRVQINVANMDESEGITIKINGISVPAGNTRRVDAETFEAVVTAPPIQRGINEIVVLPGPNSVGRLSSTVTGLELAVRYRHE